MHLKGYGREPCRGKGIQGYRLRFLKKPGSVAWKKNGGKTREMGDSEKTEKVTDYDGTKREFDNFQGKSKKCRKEGGDRS